MQEVQIPTETNISDWSLTPYAVCTFIIRNFWRFTHQQKHSSLNDFRTELVSDHDYDDELGGDDESGLRWWCDNDYNVSITFSSMDVCIAVESQLSGNSL